MAVASSADDLVSDGFVPPVLSPVLVLSLTAVLQLVVVVLSPVVLSLTGAFVLLELLLASAEADVGAGADFDTSSFDVSSFCTVLIFGVSCRYEYNHGESDPVIRKEGKKGE